jgi:hypothetical protein
MKPKPQEKTGKITKPRTNHWEEMNRKQGRELTRKIQSQDLSLELVHPDAAGIDIGNESHYIAVPSTRDMPCALFTIQRLLRCRVPEHNMGDLMECRFVWERGKRTHRDSTSVGEALNVAVQLVNFRAQSAVSISKPGSGRMGVSSPSVRDSTNQYARNRKA